MNKKKKPSLFNGLIDHRVVVKRVKHEIRTCANKNKNWINPLVVFFTSRLGQTVKKYSREHVHRTNVFFFFFITNIRLYLGLGFSLWITFFFFCLEKHVARRIRFTIYPTNIKWNMLVRGGNGWSLVSNNPIQLRLLMLFL